MKPYNDKLNVLDSLNNVGFICKRLSIADDEYFSCTIEFSDTIDNGSENIQDITESDEKYLMIQSENSII